MLPWAPHGHTEIARCGQYGKSFFLGLNSAPSEIDVFTGHRFISASGPTTGEKKKGKEQVRCHRPGILGMARSSWLVAHLQRLKMGYTVYTPQLGANSIGEVVINRQWSSLNVFSLNVQTGSAILVGDTSHYIAVVSLNPQHFSHISHNPCQEKEKKRTWEQTVKLHLRPFVPHRHKAILRCVGSLLIVGESRRFITFAKSFLVGGLEHFYFSHHIGNFIIPTDELSIIFQGGVGWNHQPDHY